MTRKKPRELSFLVKNVIQHNVGGRYVTKKDVKRPPLDGKPSCVGEGN